MTIVDEELEYQESLESQLDDIELQLEEWSDFPENVAAWRSLHFDVQLSLAKSELFVERWLKEFV